MRVQLPPRSTVEWPGGGMADTRSSEGRAHRGVRVQVPPWSLLACALSCGHKRRPSEGWLASSTLAWGTVGCLADFSAGSTKPGWQVRLLHDLLDQRGARRERGTPTSSGCNRASAVPCAPGRGVCGEDQRQARLPVHQGAGRCDPARDGQPDRPLPRRARLLRGRVLDYGCGFGFDADHFGWEAYDPHYRQKLPRGACSTPSCATTWRTC